MKSGEIPIFLVQVTILAGGNSTLWLLKNLIFESSIIQAKKGRSHVPCGEACVVHEAKWVWVNTYRYIFSGMNIHLPAILGFTRGTRVLTHPQISISRTHNHGYFGSCTNLGSTELGSTYTQKMGPRTCP